MLNNVQVLLRILCGVSTIPCHFRYGGVLSCNLFSIHQVTQTALDEMARMCDPSNGIAPTRGEHQNPVESEIARQIKKAANRFFVHESSSHEYFIPSFSEHTNDENGFGKAYTPENRRLMESCCKWNPNESCWFLPWSSER